MRRTDVRKQIDRALVDQTFRLLGGREYVEQMNPHEPGSTEAERFERLYRRKADTCKIVAKSET